MFVDRLWTLLYKRAARVSSVLCFPRENQRVYSWKLDHPASIDCTTNQGRSLGRGPPCSIPLSLRESLDHSVAAAPFAILRRFGFRARVSGDAPTLRRQRWCARAARPSPIVATTADCVPALSKQQPRPLKAAKPINLLPSSLTHDCAFALQNRRETKHYWQPDPQRFFFRNNHPTGLCVHESE